MRVLVASDAWEPQINGVVRTLQKLRDIGPSMGLELLFLTPEQFRNVPMPGYPEIRLAIPSMKAVEAVFERFDAQIIHVATEGPIGFAARKMALRRNVPLTTSYHTRFPEYLRARLPVPLNASYAALRWFHNAADAILVSTPSLRRDLDERGFQRLLPWSRGVDLDRFWPRKTDNTALPRPHFLYVGRVSVEKNLDAFLSLDLPGTKIIVGDGPQRRLLQERYPDAVFMGSLVGDALAEVYRQSDVFVFPSQTDTFGVVLLEALASGLPVAAYPVMGPVDVIAGTGAGILDHDLRKAALSCLTVKREKCLAVAETYRWETSITQFRDGLMSVFDRRKADLSGYPARAF